MAARRRTHEVFVSYAQRDRLRAEATVDALERAGIRCWIAPRNIIPGIPYAKAIVDAIAGSGVLLVLFSQAANDSEAVLNEMELAFNRAIPILPVRLEAVEPQGSSEFYLRRRQWFDAHEDYDAQLAFLGAAVRDVIGANRRRAPKKTKAPSAHSTRSARPYIAGRETELQKIDSLLAAARTGHGSVLVLQGEAGIGKTATIDQLIGRARDARMLVASTVNFEHTRTPLGPWIDLLRHLETVRRTTLVSEAIHRDYERFLGLRETSIIDPMPDRRRIFVVIVDALRHIAVRSPILLTLDDMQWADPETIELLDFATPRLADTNIAIVLGMRTDTDEPAARAVSALGRYPTTVILPLNRLPDLAIRQLIASLPTAASIKSGTIDDICRRSDGNPLFAAELVRDAVASGSSEATLPQSVKLSIASRLRNLSTTDRRLIEVAAVLGRNFLIDDLCATADCNRTEVLSTLRHARDAGLIDQSSTDVNLLSFRHELFRAVAYDELLAAERTQIHRSIGQRLAEHEGTPAALLAYHALAAGDHERAAAYAVDAGNAALRINAYASARDAFLQALETEDRDERTVAELRGKLGTAFEALGDAGEALQHFSLGATSYRSLGLTAEATRLDLRAVANAYRAGRGEDVVATCTRILAESQLAEDRFGAHAILASFYANRGNSEEALKQIDAADSVARSGDAFDVRDELSIEWARAVVNEDVNPSVSLAAAASAVGLAEARGTPALLALNLMNSSLVSTDHGRPDDARRAIDRAIALADEHGATYTSAYARCVQARAFHFAGELRESHRAIVHAVSLHVDALIVRLTIAEVGLEVMADLGLLQTFPDLQDPALLDAAFASGEEGRFAPLAAAHAHARALSGDLPGALPIIKRALTSVERFSAVAPALVVFARYGDPDDLRAIARLLPETASPGVQSLHLRVLEAIIATRSKHVDASERCVRALDELRNVRAPLLEALVHELQDDRTQAIGIYRAIHATGHLTRIDRLRG